MPANPPRAPGELAEIKAIIPLEPLGPERLTAVISDCLARSPGSVLSRPLLHDDDWRTILASLRASGDGSEAMRETAALDQHSLTKNEGGEP